MDNIVTLGVERSRPPRRVATPGGARILFFTGVRYCRDTHTDGVLFKNAAEDQQGQGDATATPSGLMLDLAAH